MGKKTDHKRLWQKAKNENVALANTVFRLRGIIEGQVETMEKIRDGKIKPEELLAIRKVKPTPELQAVIDQARKKGKHGKNKD